MEKIVVFVGRDYYFRSGTRIGLMHLLNGDRYDFGMLEQDIRKGYTVIIRPANTLELAQMDAELADLE